MITFHELISMRNMFEQILDTKNAVEQINYSGTQLDQLNSVQINAKYQNEILKLKNEFKEIEDSLITIAKSKISVLELLDEKIKLFVKKFESLGYQETMLQRRLEQIESGRTISIGSDVEDAVVNTLNSYCNWKYPGLEIGPTQGYWTKYITGFDPLYIADIHNSFLVNTIETFNKDAQSRIRPYIIRDSSLKNLPQEQFGFIFSWGFFNYVSIAEFEKYLLQIYQLLRAGGTFMFNYNNADLPAMAKFADDFTKSYAPKTILQPMVERLGFNVTRAVDFDSTNSWLEITKPGELTSIKRHIVLGKINWANT